MVGYDEQLGRDELSLPHPDPIVLELNRLQNLVKERGKELRLAHNEIKALRATEAQKDKAVEELRVELHKLDDKIRANEDLLHQKNMELKKLGKDKKDALAAQHAAEATLRRVYASQKEVNVPSMESAIAPLEAEIKMYKNEVASLLEDNKALERLTRSKESALLEAERILQSALERALIVEEVQNQNLELKRQIEICQEENRILEKANRKKVLEVEKLSQSIKQLEEAVLSRGAAANAIRDYQRQMEELNEENKTLERELARARVSATRAAAVAVSEWKDETERVMPVKQWLEERKLLQADMQRLRDKLAVSERTAMAEAQLKEKLKVRLKALEDGLKHGSSFPVNTTKANCGSPRTERTNSILGFATSNGGHQKRSISQPRGSAISRSSLLQQPIQKGASMKLQRTNSLKRQDASGENTTKRAIWAQRNKVVDSSEKENKGHGEIIADVKACDEAETETKTRDGGDSDQECRKLDDGDTVSGFLYDRVLNEVIGLRKLCGVKDEHLSVKDEEIKMLEKKVDGLNKAIEMEWKKAKREAAVKEKEAAGGSPEEKRKTRSTRLKR